MDTHPDRTLQPLIDALSRTELGLPMAQRVIEQYLDLIETVRERGHTLGQIADALKSAGIRGRNDAEITERSLSTMVGRAKKHAIKPVHRKPAAVMRSAQDETSTVRATTGSAPDEVREASIEKFRKAIDEHSLRAAEDRRFFSKR